MSETPRGSWRALRSAVIAWRARHKMGNFSVKDFSTSLLVGALIALVMGVIILYQSKDSESIHYAPAVGCLLGFAIGNAISDTDVWYSPDWFPSMNEHLRRVVMILFVALGGGRGALVEAVWGVGVRQ